MLQPGMPDRACAVFLDFDGTLVELAPRPDAVSLHPTLPGLLARLRGELDGALAIVSGRPVAEIDAQLQPLVLCAAGVHGVERRGADGYIRRIATGEMRDAAALVESLCLRHPALRMEVKRGAIALHYRQAPELEEECLATMAQAIQCTNGMTLLRGKKVVEMKPKRASKGLAVRAFMDERGFRMRRPWYFGDDVTDEGAFELVQAMGGVAVKVGDGETLAAHRLPDPAAVRVWLEQAVAEFQAQGAAASHAVKAAPARHGPARPWSGE